MASYERTIAEGLGDAEGTASEEYNYETTAEGLGDAEGNTSEEYNYETTAEGVGQADAIPVLTAAWTVAEIIGLNVVEVNQLILIVSEGIGISETNTSIVAPTVAEDIGLLETADGGMINNVVLGEGISFTDAITLAYAVIVVSGLGSANAVTEQRLVIKKVVDAFALAGVVTNTVFGNRLIAEGLALQDLLERGIGADVAEGLGSTDVVIQLVNFYLTIIENAGIAEGINRTFKAYIVTSEIVGVAEGKTINQVLQDLITEGIAFGGIMLQLDATGTAWVINTVSQGISEYDNFAFNSFTKQGQRYLAADDIGIHHLAGDTDLGVDIAARIQTGLSRFGVSQKKRVSDLYIGYKSNGSLVLKVIYNMDNTQNEAWYELTTTSAAYDNARFKVGKGAKAVYWSFDLVNEDGADFDIDTMEMHTVPLKRRL